MLNTFPILLSFDLLVPLLFRLVLGAIFVRSAFIIFLKNGNVEKEKFFNVIRLRPGYLFANLLGFIELFGGVMLILGLRVQIAALALSIITLGGFLLKFKYPHHFASGTRYYFLLFIMTFSLLFLGPGFFAFDLPL